MVTLLTFALKTLTIDDALCPLENFSAHRLLAARGQRRRSCDPIPALLHQKID